jgi:hypothetical protein
MSFNTRNNRLSSVLGTLLLSAAFVMSPHSARAAGQDSDLSQIEAAPMRRPISPQQPMWLMHIDTWNWADPQKIIDLIPEDVRPYVVMNISLSISHDDDTGEMTIAPDGYSIARSWLRTCAENRIWAVVQCASGGYSHFSEYDLSVYEEFYRDYPNFIGWNFAEQFWGFDDKFSCTFMERLGLFTELMKMAHRYGGYLISSWCGAYYGSMLNPIAMMKRSPAFAAVCRACPEHFILCEKFTMTSCFHEIESTCLGAWLSGYSGHYGIRFDQCGWNEKFGETFPEAAGAIPVLSHIMLTGETVVDGPELIWKQDTYEANTRQSSDGYTVRQWAYFPQFRNISIDLFRKLLDGSVRILNRQEVIDRTKVVIVQDINQGDEHKDYMTPSGLFKGLYQMDEDGEWLNNVTWMKKSGRYPAIPTVYTLADSLAKTFQVQIPSSGYSKRWPTVTAKVNEMNELFAEESTGDAYFSRVENAWVGYNPNVFKEANATGALSFKYNTCTGLKVSLAQYSLLQLREEPNCLRFYMTNYRTDDATLRTDTLRILGAVGTPTYTLNDRGDHPASSVTVVPDASAYVLAVRHLGPLDLTVQCSGDATDRLSIESVTPVQIERPALPSVYTGARQYEAENFDYKNIDACVPKGYGTSISGFTGQGYLSFGRAQGAAVRDTVKVDRAGYYRLTLRYSAPQGSVQNVGLYVNGSKVTTMNLVKDKAGTSWSTFSRKIKLRAGGNEVRFSAASAGSNPLYMDHMIIEAWDHAECYTFEGDAVSATAVQAPESPADMVSLHNGAAQVVKYTDASGAATQLLQGTAPTEGTSWADLDLFPTDATDYAVQWTSYFDDAATTGGLLLRATPGDETLRSGYLYETNIASDGTLKLSIVRMETTGVRTPLVEVPTSLKPAAGVAVSFRAMAVADTLQMAYSEDGSTWIGNVETTVCDTHYAQGATCLVWQQNFRVDDISCFQPRLSISRTYADGLNAIYNAEATPLELTVVGRNLLGNITVDAGPYYEVALTADGSFAQQLILSPEGDENNVEERTLYVRIRPDLALGAYEGALTLSTPYVAPRTVTLSGSVVPPSVSLCYDFETDAAKTSATNPPAQHVSVGTGNGATAGVVNYTAANDAASHWLKAYSGGKRNGTGALNLTQFTNMATDYSVSWRQAVASSSEEYKVGVLLRGNKDKVGTSTTGYVQGLMQGYVFIVYYNRSTGNGEFRIYNSTASTSLTLLTNGYVAGWNPSAGEVVYYRASAIGSTLTFEYAADGKTWQTAARYTDTQNKFTSGSTQLVWGLAAAVNNFYVDDITFEGVTYDTSVITALEEVPAASATLIATEYFTPAGVRIQSLVPGSLVIVRRTYADGHVESAKLFVR